MESIEICDAIGQSEDVRSWRAKLTRTGLGPHALPQFLRPSEASAPASKKNRTGISPYPEARKGESFQDLKSSMSGGLKFSALIEAAERGRPTIITRHGRAAAVVVPVEDARRLYPHERASFVDLLLSFPSGVAFERDRTLQREVDL